MRYLTHYRTRVEEREDHQNYIDYNLEMERERTAEMEDMTREREDIATDTYMNSEEDAKERMIGLRNKNTF